MSTPKILYHEIVFTDPGEIKEGDEVIVNGGRKSIVVRDDDGNLVARFPEVDGNRRDPSITIVRIP